jgi:hypothetical protein
MFGFFPTRKLDYQQVAMILLNKKSGFFQLTGCENEPCRAPLCIKPSPPFGSLLTNERLVAQLEHDCAFSLPC